MQGTIDFENQSNRNNLKVTTFNCKGFKFRNYEFLTKIFNDCSILLLQEHWLHNFEFKDFNIVLNNIFQ